MNKILSLFIVLSLSHKLFAQEDSTSIDHSGLMKAYNYVTMANHIETSVWKLKILPLTTAKSSIFTYDGCPIVVSYEKKIKSNLSFQLESKAIIRSTDGAIHTKWDTVLNTNQTYTYIGQEYRSSRTLFNAAVAAELRYYYNLNRKMHRKHGVNNFSANYIALRLSKNVLQTGTDAALTERQFSGDFSDQNMHPFYDNHIAGLYGIQRRVLTYFFADAQLGTAFRYGSSYNRPQIMYNTKNSSSSTTIEIDKAPRFVVVANFRIGIAF